MTSPPPKVLFETHQSIISSTTFSTTPAVTKQFKDAANPRTIARFKAEVASMLRAGEHPHLALLLSHSLPTLTLTLRHEPGLPLESHLSPENFFSLAPSHAWTILAQISSGLAHLHAKGMIHDDVTSANIVYDPTTRHAVLIDFGAALEAPYAFVESGTPSYAPPEFLERHKGPEGDVWGLGVVGLFAFGKVRVPDGEWLLPGVWTEGGDVEMREWLAEVERLKNGLEGDEGRVLSRMLEGNWRKRIGSEELVRLIRDVHGE